MQVIVGASAIVVLLIVVMVMMMGGDDEPAPPPPPAVTSTPAPAGPAPPGPPVVITVPGPPPPPLSCTGHGCIHGDCTETPATASGYTCVCTNMVEPAAAPGTLVPFTNGAVWMGEMCDERPACGVCGADVYCGPDVGCDPAVPPEPVLVQLVFPGDIASLGDADSREMRQFTTGFASDMAAALEIPPANIMVLSVTGGSINVDFAILPDANYQVVEGSAGQYAYDPADKLAALVQLVADSNSTLMHTGTFSTLGAPTNVPAAIPAASQGTCESPRPAALRCSQRARATRQPLIRHNLLGISA